MNFVLKKSGVSRSAPVTGSANWTRTRGRTLDPWSDPHSIGQIFRSSLRNRDDYAADSRDAHPSVGEYVA